MPQPEALLTNAGTPHGDCELPAMQWALFRKGRLIAESDPTITVDTQILNQLRQLRPSPDDIYLITSLAWDPPLPRPEWAQFLSGRNEALTALAFVTDDRMETIGPARSIAWNEEYAQALQRFLARNTGSTSFTIRAATATTKAVHIKTPPDETDLYRGSPLVGLADETTTDRALAIASGLANWTTRTLDELGHLPQLWNTSLEQAAPAPSSATDGFLIAMSLTAFANHQGDPHLLAASHRLRADLLNQHFEPLDDRSAVTADEKGPTVAATSIAGLALLTGIHGPEPSHEEHLVKLLRSIRSTAHQEHGFQPFLFHDDNRPTPPGRGSGEALLFLCEACRLNVQDAPAVDELLVLFRRCRDRWREQRRPTPVPWYSQALKSLHGAHPRRELADAVFEMNDWLLNLQPTTSAAADRLGEFADPRRPEHGTSDASTVASNLAGLADAKALAETLGDHARCHRYDTAITKALRLLRQLQFRDWSCTWYLKRPEAVLGAVRINVDDNRVKLGACGLALLAVTKLLSQPEPPSPAQADNAMPALSP